MKNKELNNLSKSELFEIIKSNEILEGLNQSSSYDEFITDIYPDYIGEGDEIKAIFYKEIEKTIDTDVIDLAGSEDKEVEFGDIDIMKSKFKYNGKTYEVIFEHIIGDSANNILELNIFNND